MKAYVLHDVNQIVYEDIETPKISDEEVLIEVKAVGICGSDIPRIYKTGAHVHPIVPGHEFCGTVKAVGKAVDPQIIGKRMGVFPLIPCFKCDCCKKKEYEMCKNYSYLGSRRDGGFSEYVAVPYWNLIELDDSVSDKAAAMLEPLSVAAHAVRRLTENFSKDKNLLVYGIGTIGLLIGMILKAEGYEKVFYIGKKEKQISEAEKIGMSLLKKDLKADAVFECVGTNEVISDAIMKTSPGGRIMFVGNPASDISLSKETYWKLLRNQLTVFGTWNSSFTKDEKDDWHYVLKLIKEKKINPEMLVTHSFSLSELKTGLEIMRDKSEDYIKIMGVN